MWTRFFDMASGGGCKVVIDGRNKEYIFIEFPEDEAAEYFERRFDRDPYNVTCDCCGGDYSISDYETLEQATDYERRGDSLESFVLRDDVLVIRAHEIVTG